MLMSVNLMLNLRKRKSHASQTQMMQAWRAMERTFIVFTEHCGQEKDDAINIINYEVGQKAVLDAGTKGTKKGIRDQSRRKHA